MPRECERKVTALREKKVTSLIMLVFTQDLKRNFKYKTSRRQMVAVQR